MQQLCGVVGGDLAGEVSLVGLDGVVDDEAVAVLLLLEGVAGVLLDHLLADGDDVLAALPQEDEALWKENGRKRNFLSCIYFFKVEKNDIGFFLG